MEYRNCGDCEHYARVHNAYMTAVDDKESALRDLAAARRKVEAYKQAVTEFRNEQIPIGMNIEESADWIDRRVRELLADPQPSA